MSYNSTPHQPLFLADMDTSHRALFVPSGHIQLDRIENAIGKLNTSFHENPLAYFTRLEHSLAGINAVGIQFSVIFDEQSAKSEEIVLSIGGVSDGTPTTQAEKVAQYAISNSTGHVRRELSQPGSWGSLMRADAIHSLVGMPVVTVLRPIGSHKVYSDNASRIADGEYGSYSSLINWSVDLAREIIHGSEDDKHIKTVHLHGLSLGARELLGAVAEVSDRLEILGYKIGSLTMQELIIGPRDRKELRKFRQITGEGSTNSLDGFTRIPEPDARMALDRNGSEFGMYLRMGKSVLRRSLLDGLTDPWTATEDVLRVADAGIPITIALAENSYATKDTESEIRGSASYRNLPPNTRIIYLGAVPGKQLGHIANEHHALVAAVALEGSTIYN